METPGPKASHETRSFRMWRWLFCVAALGFIAVFLCANWSGGGKRAWEKYLRESEALGESLDWSKHIPAPVPDEQNIFMAPKMAAWFVGRGGNELSRRLEPQCLYVFLVQRYTNALARVEVVSPDDVVSEQDADLFLEYRHHTLTAADARMNSWSAPGPSPAVIPLIVMDEVPLSDAIKNLARVANLKYTIDPQTGLGTSNQGSRSAPEPQVSLRWSNITAQHALEALLNNYNLMLVDDPKTRVARIISSSPSGPHVLLAPALREQIGDIIKRSLTRSTNDSCGPVLTGAQGIRLATGAPNRIQPARVLVRAEETPTVTEMTEFFPSEAFQSPGPAYRSPRVESGGSNSFLVFSSPPPVCSAVDYLAWSDQFEPDFDLIREALKRPLARMDDDYQQPSTMPIPNFVTLRYGAQTLAQRAQSCLLLGRPEQALRELTLLHDLRRFTETKPTTLVAAMINTAITGLYADVVGDGLRLQVWREAELRALQAQLAEVNLLPQVKAAFEIERAAVSRNLETASTDELKKLVDSDSRRTTWQKLKDPEYLTVTLLPRGGWVYQNMLTHARLVRNLTDAFDLQNGVISPRLTTAANDAAQAELTGFSPSTFLAKRALPSFSRLSQTLAQVQAKVSEALVACALERYRLVNGQYPDSLAALTPKFIGTIPHDIITGEPLKYRRTDDGRFVLYSVGWNEKDDGGTVVLNQSTLAPEVGQGDWVWAQSSSK